MSSVWTSDEFELFKNKLANNELECPIYVRFQIDVTDMNAFLKSIQKLQIPIMKMILIGDTKLMLSIRSQRQDWNALIADVEKICLFKTVIAASSFYYPIPLDIFIQ